MQGIFRMADMEFFFSVADTTFSFSARLITKRRFVIKQINWLENILKYTYNSLIINAPKDYVMHES
jgi:hypothetical protein